ncbi:histidine kinase [Streptomyces sp. NPDC006367]|uniref:sensor histidine kinase n=1 Tax=unclassified Streptomyces TaxID=2593676 RepID=UPI00339ED826
MWRRTGTNQATLVAFLSLFLLIAGSFALLAADVLAQPLSRRALITGVVLLILLPAVLLGQYAPPPYRLPYRWRWGLLVVQALLTYLPVLVFEYRWLSLLGFLAGAVLLTVPRPASVLIALAVAASGPLLVNVSIVHAHRSGMSVLASTLITGSGVYAVVHLALLVTRLQASHSQATRLAAHRERARIAQDLHDLVGASLVSIAVQSENALRRTPVSTPAYEALRDIAALARRTHAEVPGITEGRVSTRLHAELAHAQRLLSGAGITTRTTLPPRLDLSPPVSDCLGAVLREAVGNVLRHSRASRCDIAVTREASGVRLSIGNDGLRPGAGAFGAFVADGPGSGRGLGNLRLRVLALNGSLETSLDGRRFLLTADLPLGPATAGAPSAVPATPPAPTPGRDPVSDRGSVTDRDPVPASAPALAPVSCLSPVIPAPRSAPASPSVPAPAPAPEALHPPLVPCDADRVDEGSRM